MGSRSRVGRVGAACVALTVLVAAGGGAALPAEGASHTFNLTYRGFGAVTATSAFRAAGAYAVRFEGCYAKHGEEAICGFTLRAARPLTLTNVGNASHASDANGASIRTCCMFVQGDDRGYPITKASAPPPGAAVLDTSLATGQAVGLMLRVPGYRRFGPLAAITVSTGSGDAGVSFPAQVEELP